MKKFIVLFMTCVLFFAVGIPAKGAQGTVVPGEKVFINNHFDFEVNTSTVTLPIISEVVPGEIVYPVENHFSLEVNISIPLLDIYKLEVNEYIITSIADEPTRKMSLYKRQNILKSESPYASPLEHPIIKPIRLEANTGLIKDTSKFVMNMSVHERQNSLHGVPLYKLTSNPFINVLQLGAGSGGIAA